MQKLCFLLMSFMFLTVARAQSIVKDPNAQERKVETFHALRVSTGIEVYLVQGDEEKVVVSADEVSHRDRIRTEVTGGVLHIYYDAETFKWGRIIRSTLKAYVSIKSIDGLNVASGARVNVDGTLKSPNLDMRFSSGGKFKGRVEAGTLMLDGSSGSRADVSGTASSLKAEVSSGSHLDGFDLSAVRCDVSASSGAHINISVEKEMEASAHSGGHVNYQGNGVIREIHTGSGGSVSRR